MFFILPDVIFVWTSYFKLEGPLTNWNIRLGPGEVTLNSIIYDTIT